MLSCDSPNAAIGFKTSQYIGIDDSWCSTFHIPMEEAASQVQVVEAVDLYPHLNHIAVLSGGDVKHLKGDAPDLLVDQLILICGQQ